jgi:hypothetical protein
VQQWMAAQVNLTSHAIVRSTQEY